MYSKNSFLYAFLIAVVIVGFLPYSFALNDTNNTSPDPSPVGSGGGGGAVAPDYYMTHKEDLIDDFDNYWKLYDHDTEGSGPYNSVRSVIYKVNKRNVNKVTFNMGGVDWRALEVFVSSDGVNWGNNIKNVCCYGSGQQSFDAPSYSPFYVKFKMNTGSCCGTGSYITLDKSLILETSETVLIPPCESYGDVNNDGFVTDADASMIADSWTDNKGFTEDKRNRADVNGNFFVDGFDRNLILDYLQNKISTFSVCRRCVSSLKIELSSDVFYVGETGKKAIIKVYDFNGVPMPNKTISSFEIRKNGVSVEKSSAITSANGVYEKSLDSYTDSSSDVGSYEIIALVQGNDCNSVIYREYFEVKNSITGSTCTETDGGLDYYVKGILSTKSSGSTGTYYDLCFNGGNTLHEWYCKESKPIESIYECPNGCIDGACIKQATSSNTDLMIKSIKKGDFHEYGFLINLCVYGNKSINDIKKENPNITNFPNSYKVFDSYGNEHETHLGAGGGIETIKNGQCQDLGLAIQESDQKYYDQNKRLTVILDSNNFIEETNEYNNMITYEGNINSSYCGNGVCDSGETYLTCSDCPKPTSYYSTGCTDSDGGKNYYVKGILKKRASDDLQYLDYCSNDGKTLYEQYCDGFEYGGIIIYGCPSGCFDGACSDLTIQLDPTDPYWVSKKGTTYQDLGSEWYVNGPPGGGLLDIVTHVGALDLNTQYYLNFDFSGQGWWAIRARASTDGVTWTNLYYTCTWRTGVDCPSDQAGKKQVMIPKKFNRDLYLQFSPSSGSHTSELIRLKKEIHISMIKDSSIYKTICPIELNSEKYHWTDDLGCVPVSVGCIQYNDEYGCIISKCSDGRRAITCPTNATLPNATLTPNINIKTEIKKGWNLVSLLNFGNYNTESTCKVSDFASIYSYFPIEKKYGKYQFINSFESELVGVTTKDQELWDEYRNPTEKGYLISTLLNSVWIYSKNNCELNAEYPYDYTGDGLNNILDNVVKERFMLAKGWNFFTVLPEMSGKTMDELKGDCMLTKKGVYYYDAESNNWGSIINRAFYEDEVGKAILIKVSKDCVFGGSSGSTPPKLPEENEPCVKTPPVQVFGSAEQLQVSDWSLDINNDLTMDVKNLAGNDILITAGKLKLPVSLTGTLSSSVHVPSGEDATINIDGEGMGVSGDCFNADVSLTYSVTGGVLHTMIGQIRGKYRN